jgi:hypothetical protein
VIFLIGCDDHAIHVTIHDVYAYCGNAVSV